MFYAFITQQILFYSGFGVGVKVVTMEYVCFVHDHMPNARNHMTSLRT